MKTNHQQRECDPQLLQGYLDDTLSSAEQQQVEAHLCQCHECRNALDQSAAEHEWWGHAGAYLREDAWDDVSATTTSATRLETPGQTDDAHLPLASRQIQEWLDASDDPRMLGRFGGYEIVGIVGQGGMGVVMKGFEPSLNRYVAIKVLAPLLATSGAARKRFAREAKATAAVLHDNVIPIHRVDEAHNLPFLVMPYVSDTPLQKRIDDEAPLPLVAILRIGEQIAAGLAAAHAHGLVHRDIKPANILLETGVERVRITDFGLARAADDGSLTRTGVIAGTPQYMSPEQARGDSVDARSDLFSLGSVLYAMATGRLPFRAETPYGILRRITDTEPRAIREINPELPEWLAAMISKLHAKRVEDRFASADEVADLLKRCLAYVEQPTANRLPPECRTGVDDVPAEHTVREPSNDDADRIVRKASDDHEGRRAQMPPIQSVQRTAPFVRTANRKYGLQILVVVIVTAICGFTLVGRGWLTTAVRPKETSAENVPETVAVPGANTKDSTEATDDFSIAWDITAQEISQLTQEASPFESQAQQMWDTTPIKMSVTPNSTSPATSAEDQVP